MTIDTASTLALELRDDEITRCQSMPYRDYLKTPWWDFVHDRTLRHARNRCEMCGGAATEAHHTTYERLGHERPDDMVAVCRQCHQHITDNGLNGVRRSTLLARRRQYLHSPEFSRSLARV